MARHVKQVLEALAAASLEPDTRLVYVRLAILACRKHPMIGLKSYDDAAPFALGCTIRERNSRIQVLLDLVQDIDVAHPLKIKTDRDCMLALADYRKFSHVLRSLGFVEESQKFEKSLRAACQKHTSSLNDT